MASSLETMSNEELWQLFPIILSEYKEEWGLYYADEECSLRSLIGSACIYRISHIGSTAVRGLTAKPTIDILVEINQGTDIRQLIETLQNSAYIFSRQPSKPSPHLMFMKGYTSTGFADRVFHLHIRYPGDWDELYFRDYLQLHDHYAEQYVLLKKRLQKEFEHDRDAYTGGKGAFISMATKKAREEFGGKYLPL